MLMKTAIPAGLARGVGSSRLSAVPCLHSTIQQQQHRRVTARFKEDTTDNPQKVELVKEDLEQQLQQDAQAQDLRQQPLQPLFTPSEPKLSGQQLQEVRALLLVAGLQCITEVAMR